MAGYGYRTYGGMEPRSDDGWSKPSYQHVFRPVTIDAEGRKQPIIPAPHIKAGKYVVKTEITYVEQVHAPMGLKNLRTGPAEDAYEFNKQQGLPLRSAVHNRPQIVEEFITKVQTEASNPTRTIPFGTVLDRRPTGTGYNATRDYGDHNNNNNNGGDNGYSNGGNRARYWSKPPSEETRLTKPTNDINTAIEYLKEAAITEKPLLGNNGTTTATGTNSTKPRFTLGVPPRRSGYAGTTSTTPMETITSGEEENYANTNGFNTATGHDDYSDSNNGGQKGYNHRQINEPNRAEYRSKPPSEETRVTKPTSDISTSIDYSKEADITANPPLSNNGTTTTATATTANFKKPMFALGVVPPRRTDSASTTSTTAMDTITSTEAERRYGTQSLPFKTGEEKHYANTIDSREAIIKYNGINVRRP